MQTPRTTRSGLKVIEGGKDEPAPGHVGKLRSNNTPENPKRPLNVEEVKELRPFDDMKPQDYFKD